MGSKWRKLLLVCALAFVILAFAGYAILRLTGLMSPDACISEEVKTIPDVSGARVDVVYTNCDTLVKDEAIRLYMSRAESGGEPLLQRWFNRRQLIFEYDPAGQGQPPTVQASDNGRLLISVSNVSQVFIQRRKWRELGIDYKIEHVTRP